MNYWKRSSPLTKSLTSPLVGHSHVILEFCDRYIMYYLVIYPIHNFPIHNKIYPYFRNKFCFSLIFHCLSYFASIFPPVLLVRFCFIFFISQISTNPIRFTSLCFSCMKCLLYKDEWRGVSISLLNYVSILLWNKKSSYFPVLVFSIDILVCCPRAIR